ncbi:MAG: amidohydrolase family protein [Acidobacteriota bacterium]|nr:amidohydrolase family protein [Acidobacteriota bacterium]
MSRILRSTLTGVVLVVAAVSLSAQQMPPTPARGAGDGEGPFDRMVIRGVTVIDGTGAPPRGPMDVVVQNNRITEVASVGFPGVAINERSRPAKGTKEVDGTGLYLMPGFVDAHVHCGGGQARDPEYVYKLWLSHGVTTVRGVPCGSMDWDLNQRELSAKNQIVAPRIFAYHRPFSGEGWDRNRPQTPDSAREWVRFAAKKGVDGMKLGAYDPEIMAALLDEAKKFNLGSTAHLDQMGVGRMNARDASRLGLGSLTHYYGLFEALLKDYSVQPFPLNQNYNDEQHRFGQVARLHDKIHPRGSEPWNALIKEWVDARFTIDPTMNIYSAGRDVMRMREAEWHDKYTLPSLWDFYQPNRNAHGAYWFYWTTEDEIQWKRFYQVWMSFLNDFKNAGGRVTTGSDSGFIYQTYGFGYILELEMLQEAGFHPLEVIRSATLNGAATLAEPKGTPADFGIIRAGLLADMVLVDQNPLENFKVLYATGAVKLNDQTGQVDRVGGVKYTIKDGIVYDAKKLAADVAAIVQKARSKPATTARQ